MKETSDPPVGLSDERGPRSFDAIDVRVLHRWLQSGALGAGFAGVPSAPADIRETYYDTADWRVHRSGLTLCIRRESRSDAPVEAVMDPLPREATRVLHRVSQPLSRPCPGALTEAPGPVADRVIALVGAHALEERFELCTQVSTVTVSHHGTPLILVHLRHGAIPLTSDRRPVDFDLVTVEAPTGWSSEAQAVVERMRRTFGLQPAASSLYAASLRALGMAPPASPDLGPTTIDVSSTAGEAAMAVLRRQFTKMLQHEPGTRLGDDPEELHDMRVAVRRMRAALKLFASYLPARALSLRTELTWLGRALGEVRDLDVQIATVGSWREHLARDDARAVEELIGWLVEHRAGARRRMIRALDSRRFERLTERMAGTLRRGSLRSGPVHQAPIVVVAPPMIERCVARAAKQAGRLKKSSPASAFHRARIRFKALRYALEFHREVYGKACEDVIKRLAKLQDVLGEHQDADVATTWLRELVTTQGRRLRPDTLFVAGRMSERYARRARERRRESSKCHRQFESRGWSRLRHRMERLKASSGFHAEGDAQPEPTPATPVARASGAVGPAEARSRRNVKDPGRG